MRAFLLLVVVFLVGGCDSSRKLTDKTFPPYEGRFVIFDKGANLGSLTYEKIKSFDFQKDGPGDNDRWVEKTVAEAKRDGANGIIDFKVGTAFALWSITATGSRTTGTMVFFNDVTAAAEWKAESKSKQSGKTYE